MKPFVLETKDGDRIAVYPNGSELSIALEKKVDNSFVHDRLVFLTKAESLELAVKFAEFAELMDTE